MRGCEPRITAKGERMAFDSTLVAAKLRRWEKHLSDYSLPDWEAIPDFGLYMEQVVTLLAQWLDYLPPELKDGELITAAAINNYVRKKIMPEPVKKRYYRTHLAYLLIICTLKQSLSIATLQALIPANLTEDEVRDVYTAFARRHKEASLYFIKEVRMAAADVLHPGGLTAEEASARVEDLIVGSALTSGFARLMAEKLLALDGQAAEAAE